MEQIVRLKDLRRKLRLTQAKAAQGIGIDQRQWNRYETGKNAIPVKYFKAICINFNVSADWLLGIEK